MFAGHSPWPVLLFKAEQELKAHFHVLSLYLVSELHFLEPSRKWRAARGLRARMPTMPRMCRNLPHPDKALECISPLKACSQYSAITPQHWALLVWQTSKSEVGFLTCVLQQKVEFSAFISATLLFAEQESQYEAKQNCIKIHFRVTCLIDKIIEMLRLPAKELCRKIITTLVTSAPTLAAVQCATSDDYIEGPAVMTALRCHRKKILSS